MLISEIFKPSNIKINLESTDKEELFEELVSFLVDVERLDNREQIISSLWDRERKMTTGIVPNIAIPHTSLSGINKTVGALGITKRGIDYDSLDGKPVHLVFFLLGDKKKPNEHLTVLKNLASMLSNPDFYSEIMKCSTAEQANEKIVEFEDTIKFSSLK